MLYFKDGRLKPVPNWHGELEIEVIYRDAHGHMWIGTDGAGVFEYSGGAFRNYRTGDGLASNYVRAILGDRNGTLWFSTFGAGLSRYSHGAFSTVATADGLAGDRVVARLTAAEMSAIDSS